MASKYIRTQPRGSNHTAVHPCVSAILILLQRSAFNSLAAGAPAWPSGEARNVHMLRRPEGKGWMAPPPHTWAARLCHVVARSTKPTEICIGTLFQTRGCKYASCMPRGGGRSNGKLKIGRKHHCIADCTARDAISFLPKCISEDGVR